MAAPTAIGRTPARGRLGAGCNPAQAFGLQESSSGLRWLMPLLDTLPDTVFFLKKDHEAAAWPSSKTLTDRLGVKTWRAAGPPFWRSSPTSSGHQYGPRTSYCVADSGRWENFISAPTAPNGWCLTTSCPAGCDRPGGRPGGEFPATCRRQPPIPCISAWRRRPSTCQSTTRKP